ncbi:MAG: arsenite methyltransferase [Acidobacteriota bacterium]
MKDEEIKKAVREGYAKTARRNRSCCGPVNPCCESTDEAQDIGKKLGYTEGELTEVPEGANLGLGCGNPIALASLRAGETVLDLGSGAGFDCFIAANKVGPNGRVIGVDMTPEMIDRARESARRGNYENVEFRLGEIEHLPVADNSADVVISNCVINLVPDKKMVFREAFRALKPGGRLIISDIVLLRELPDCIQSSVEAYVGCISGAMMRDEYLSAIKAAGFQEVRVIDEKSFPIELLSNDPTAMEFIERLKVPVETLKELASSVVSISVYALKPNETT